MQRARPRAAARIGMGLLLAAPALTACEPVGPLAGGRLGGELVRERVTDWSFADGYETIQIETRIDDPHSVTVWCSSHEGRLYIPSRNASKKRWVRNVLEDPRVRVRIGGRIYAGSAARVTDEAELEAAVPSLLRKYDLEPPEEGEHQDTWLFRIDGREPD